MFFLFYGTAVIFYGPGIDFLYLGAIFYKRYVPDKGRLLRKRE